MKTLFTTLFLALVISVSASTNNDNKSEEKHSASVASVSISGKIIDSVSKESLAGVKVVIGNTGVVAYTDFDGNFSVEVPENCTKDEVVVSYISYEEAVVSLKEKNSIIEISQIN
jgi:hypothetical protein